MDKQALDELKMAAFYTQEQAAEISAAARYLLYKPDHAANRQRFLEDAGLALRQIMDYIQTVREAHEAETSTGSIDPACLKKDCCYYDNQGDIYLVLATGPKRTTRKRIYLEDGTRTYGKRLYNETPHLRVLGLLEESEISRASYALKQARLVNGPLEQLPCHEVVAIVRACVESHGSSNPPPITKGTHFVDMQGKVWHIASSGRQRTLVEQVYLVGGAYHRKHKGTACVYHETNLLQGDLARKARIAISKEQAVPFLKALRSKRSTLCRKPAAQEITEIVAALQLLKTTP